MRDPYLYDDVPVLRNKLGIKNEKALNLVEAEQSCVNMMLLYERGFDDFSPMGLRTVHRTLFEDVYDWAGEYRLINVEKREKLLGGRSVWYSNDEDIPENLEEAFAAISETDWEHLTREQFVAALVRHYSKIWQVHPFREGNTRTVVMMLTFFVEHYGYYMDQDLLKAGAGYIRDAFVMTCLDEYSEYEHLEKILLDAVCTELITYDESTLEVVEPLKTERYRKYQKENYVPQPHYQRENKKE